MATTLAAILTRMRASVLEVDPWLLVPSREAFSATRQPNTLVNNAYWLDDGGLVSNRSVGNHRAVRIDAVDVLIARKASFATETDREAVLTLLFGVERALKADGETQGYHVTLTGHSVRRQTGRDYIVGTLRLNVDYDCTEAPD